MRKLTYYVACSVDGFIGDATGDGTAMLAYLDEEFLDFLRTEYPETVPTHGRRALGFDDLENRRFDTIVQGRASYDLALKEGIPSAYAHLRQYVASRTLAVSPSPDVEIVADGLVDKVRELKAEDGDLGIYLCGGSRVAGELYDEIDELVIKTYPVVYGTGMPMFAAGSDLTRFGLTGTRTFGNGAVVRTYARQR
ncbi:dihydrofolate reductase family protein [Streptomyces asoensis]|uniref:dihydrofolate reductase family protein n=1 Tax=Streptomyces asoensis TaxID=249586 RepID=UPI0033D025D0